jgi:hypothetical protein
MKKLYIIVLIVFIEITLFSQAPLKFSYQAVIRNSSNTLVVNQQIGIRVSILSGSIDGSEVYKEVFSPNPQTNSNGLLTVDIGTGIPISSTFSDIDWSTGPYFIKTEIDISGGTNYAIVGTSQLLSVPYALYSKLAESLIGDINETDPVFDTWDKSTGIVISESQISDLGNYLKNETDPVYLSSQAANITASDITRLGNLSGTNTGDQDGSETKIEAGANIWVAGNGTNGNPYIMNYYPTHYIGELFGGGVIFWIDHTGKHGLIVGMVDISTTIWSNVNLIYIGTANSDWDGLSNSIAIKEQIGHTTSAAVRCLEYVNSNYDTGIYSDWYLPCREELNHLWNNIYEVQKALSTYGSPSTPMVHSGYWSSTEYSDGGAWSFDFGNGNLSVLSKDQNEYVRAIRYF